MTLTGRFFNPGPVEVDTEVAQAMLRPMIGHRGPEARALVGRLQPGLQTLFGTTRPVMMSPAFMGVSCWLEPFADHAGPIWGHCPTRPGNDSAVCVNINEKQSIALI